MGHLPDCEADQLLKLMPAVQPIKPSLITDSSSRSSVGHASEGEVDAELEQALRASRDLVENDDDSLQKALAMSMQGRY